MIIKGRIAFRAWEKEDIPLLSTWLNDPEIFRYLGESYPCKSSEQVVEYYEERKSQPYRYMILQVQDGRPVGTCRIFDIDWKYRTCELALLIGDKKSWGKGFGTDSLELLKEVAFLGLGMNRVQVKCFASNARILRICEKASFLVEGTLREKVFFNGRYENIVVMSILFAEYFGGQVQTQFE